MTQTLLRSDTFTRSDTSTGAAGSTTGAGWNLADIQGGRYNITSNQLVCTPEGTSSYKRDFLLCPSIENPRDSQIILDLAAVDGTSRTVYAVFRWIDASNFYLVGLQYQTGASVAACNIYSYVGGVLTTLLTTTGTLTVGHTHRFTASCTGSGNTTLTYLVEDTSGSPGPGITSHSKTDTNNPAALQVAGRMGIDVNNGAITLTQMRTYYQNQTTTTAATATPATVSTTGGAQTVTLTGVGSTGWTNGVTAFHITTSNCTCSIGSTTVSGVTAATVPITPSGTASGSVVLSDSASPFDGSSNCVVVIVNAPSMTSGTATIAVSSTGNSVVLTGANVTWTAGTPGTPTFSLAGGTGASITAQVVNTSSQVTLTISAGSAGGTLTITDPSNNITCTVLVVVTYLANNASLYWSPFSTHVNSTRAQSQSGGSYGKWGWTGTYCLLNVSVANQVAGSVSAGNYPTVRVSIDNGTYVDYVLTSASTTLLIASGLSQGNHTTYIRVNVQGASYDRWVTPVLAMQVTGVVCDGVLIAPTLQAKTILFYGDSYHECKALGDDTGTATTVDASVSIIIAVADALGAEYGPCCFNGTGVTVAYDGVPALYTGTDATQRWDKYASGLSFLSAGLMVPQPDYIIQYLGTNDINANAVTLRNAVSGWFAAVRAAAPNAIIFWVLPIRQIAQPTSVTAIKNGIADYQASAPSDTRIHTIDLGIEAGRYLQGTAGGATIDGADGLHPRKIKDARLAAQTVSLILQALSRGRRRGG